VLEAKTDSETHMLNYPVILPVNFNPFRGMPTKEIHDLHITSRSASDSGSESHWRRGGRRGF
jgi:hypothetical protein